MTKNELEIHNTIPPDVLKAVDDGLAEHTTAQNAPPLVVVPISIAMRDEQQKVVAGLYGETFWNWLWVKGFWVNPEKQRQGLGTRILCAAEEVAKKRGCVGVYLWTESFDAPGFYAKLGYHLFAELENLPVGHKGLCYKKQLG